MCTPLYCRGLGLFEWQYNMETRPKVGWVCGCPLPQEVLDIARLLLVELEQHDDCEIEEKKSKLEQLKTVLEM